MVQAYHASGFSEKTCQWFQWKNILVDSAFEGTRNAADMASHQMSRPKIKTNQKLKDLLRRYG